MVRDKLNAKNIMAWERRHFKRIENFVALRNWCSVVRNEKVERC